MPLVMLPDKDELVKELTRMLMVLNEQDKRQTRWTSGVRARAWIPQAQLEERARNIAQSLILLPQS